MPYILGENNTDAPHLNGGANDATVTVALPDIDVSVLHENATLERDCKMETLSSRARSTSTDSDTASVIILDDDSVVILDHAKPDSARSRCLSPDYTQELVAAEPPVSLGRPRKAALEQTPASTHRIQKVDEKILKEEKLQGSSIVAMLHERIFHAEGTGRVEPDGREFVRIHALRAYNLDKALSVRYSTVANESTAVVDRHYRHTTGIVVFEPGASIISFDVEIVNDDLWEPIRDFAIRLERVIKGDGIIGVLDTCICTIVDDDLYPAKCVRTKDTPIPPAELVLPSCLNVDEFLSVDEIGDVVLISGFFVERFKQLWPSSMWATVWAVYRGFYRVCMSLLMILFIDFVWEAPEDHGEEALTQRDWRIFLGGLITLAVIVATILQSCTEKWIVNDYKCGLTSKQFRDWIVAQLLWADSARLSMMENSEFLAAATFQVENLGQIYERVFMSIERIAHFVLNVIMIACVIPEATCVIFLLIPVTIGVHSSRSQGSRLLLNTRLEAQRKYLSSLATIVEHAAMIRGLGVSPSIQRDFAAKTQAFSTSHLAAVQYSIGTKERIELFQGLILAATLFGTGVLVNDEFMTAGHAAGLVLAFLKGSDDLVFLSNVMLQMQFSTEGLRKVSRILNMPTDAHRKAASAVTKDYTKSVFTNEQQERIKRTGFLKKRGQTNAAFKNRFFVLDGTDVQYFASEADYRAKRAPKGSISCIGLGLNKDGGHTKDGYLFTLFLSNKKVIECASQSDADRTLWLEAFECAQIVKSEHPHRASAVSQPHPEAYQQEQDDVEEDPSALHWMNTVSLNQTLHLNSRKSLLSAHLQAAEKDEDQYAQNSVSEKTTAIQETKKIKLQVRICMEFRLGGMILLQRPSDEETEILYRFLVGLYLPHEEDVGSVHLPPHLRYAYCPETPVLFEGSILRNLLLGTRHLDESVIPSDEEAWTVAERCGLDEEFMGAPESFNVGQNGYNLPASARQSISLARSVLSDPDVILLHKPVAFLSPEQAEKFLTTMKDFIEFGGLRGMLTGKKKAHNSSPASYLIRNGTPTVIISGIPANLSRRFVSRHVNLQCHWNPPSKSTSPGASEAVLSEGCKSDEASGAVKSELCMSDEESIHSDSGTEEMKGRIKELEEQVAELKAVIAARDMTIMQQNRDLMEESGFIDQITNT